MTTPLRFKCMYPTCHKLTLENSSVCGIHLVFEIALAGGAVLATAFIGTWFLYHFSVRQLDVRELNSKNKNTKVVQEAQ